MWQMNRNNFSMFKPKPEPKSFLDKRIWHKGELQIVLQSSQNAKVPVQITHFVIIMQVKYLDVCQGIYQKLPEAGSQIFKIDFCGVSVRDILGQKSRRHTTFPNPKLIVKFFCIFFDSKEKIQNPMISHQSEILFKTALLIITYNSH